MVLPGGEPGDDRVVLAGYHRWLGEVLEQSAGDDPGMDKITVSAGVLYPCDQKASLCGLREAAATGNQGPAKMGRTAQIGHTLRSPA